MILYGFASRGGGNVMLGDVSFERRNYRAVPGYLGLQGSQVQNTMKFPTRCMSSALRILSVRTRLIDESSHRTRFRRFNR
jgi:hypothetical protein